MSDDLTALAAQFAQEQVDELEQRFPRSLRDNPEGQRLLSDAIERAVLLGVHGWAVGSDPADRFPEQDEHVWMRWQAQRDLTPEAERWPERLVASERESAQSALQAAEAELVDAGGELGMTGAGGGRRARWALAELGRQAAEAGAALVCALDDPLEEEAEPPLAVPAVPLSAPPGSGLVRVANASNLAECELLQGLLANAGIPSEARRGVWQVPDMLAAGDRDILVPTAAADQARTVLATVEDTGSDPQEERTRAVGLERAGLRRLGTLTIVFWISGGLFIPVVVGTLLGTNAALVAAVVYIVAVVLAVAWIDNRN